MFQSDLITVQRRLPTQLLKGVEHHLQLRHLIKGPEYPETRHEDEKSHSTTTIHPQCSSTAAVSITDIDSSSKESFFPGFQQDSIYSEPGPTSRLATLLGATPLEPIFEFTSIVNRKDKTQSLHELSTPNTFLTDSCINAFCVS